MVLPDEVLPTAYSTLLDTTPVADARCQTVPAAELQLCADATLDSVSVTLSASNQCTTVDTQSRRLISCMARRTITRQSRRQSIYKLNRGEQPGLICDRQRPTVSGHKRVYTCVYQEVG